MQQLFTPSCPRIVTTALLCLALTGPALGLTGCAKRSAPAATATSVANGWPMTPEASETYYYLMLDEAIRQNNKELAGKAVRNLLMMEPPVRVYLDAAGFYIRREDPVVARTILKEGIERFPEELPLTLLLTETYLQEERTNDALGVLRDYLIAYPESTAARQELGMLLFRSGLYPEAADTLGANIAGRNEPLTRYYYARVLNKLERLKEAEAELKQAVKDSPNFIEAWAELAFIYELQKDFLAAEATYEHIISIGHAGEEVWLRLVSINLKLNRPDQALELARIGPVTDSFILQAASLFMEESFFEQSKALLTPYAAQQGAPEEVRFHLALIAYRLDQDYRAAITHLEAIPDQSRLWDRATLFRSQLLYEMGKADEAIDLINRARMSDPGNRTFWEMHTDLLASTEQFDSALAMLAQALERWKDDPELLYTRGSVQDKMGDKKGAMLTMEQVISVDPEHANALNYVGYTLAEEGRDLERALVLVQNALKQEPDKHYMLDSLAWVQFKLGNFDEAWDTINRVVELGLDDPEVWEHYGDIAKAKGLLKEARKGYERALASQPPNADELIRKLGEL